MASMRRLTIGDLTELGLPTPEDGAATRFAAEGRVPTSAGAEAAG